MRSAISKSADQTNRIEKLRDFNKPLEFDRAAFRVDATSASGGSRQSTSAIDGWRTLDKAISMNKRAGDVGSISGAFGRMDTEYPFGVAKSPWDDRLTAIREAQAKWMETHLGVTAESLSRLFFGASNRQSGSVQTNLLRNLAPRPMAPYEIAATKIAKQVLESNGTLMKSLQPFIGAKRNPAVAAARPVGLDYASTLGRSPLYKTVADMAEKLAAVRLNARLSEAAYAISGLQPPKTAAIAAGIKPAYLAAETPSLADTIRTNPVTEWQNLAARLTGQVFGLRQEQLAALAGQFSSPGAFPAFTTLLDRLRSGEIRLPDDLFPLDPDGSDEAARESDEVATYDAWLLRAWLLQAWALVRANPEKAFVWACQFAEPGAAFLSMRDVAAIIAVVAMIVSIQSQTYKLDLRGEASDRHQ